MRADARGEPSARGSSDGGGGTVDRWGAVPAARRAPDTVAARIALDHGGGSGENWSVMVPMVSFAAHPRSR